MIQALFRRELKSGCRLLFVFMGVLTLYVSMIIAMYDPALGDSLAVFSKSMPELFAAFGMAEVGSTLLQFIANYLYGFLLVVFPLVFILLLSARLMARYIDRGSMAYLLALPHKRRAVAITQAGAMLSFLFLLVAFVTVLGWVLSGAMFRGALEVQAYLRLNLCWFGLLVFLGGICFCSACIFTDTKYSLGVGGGICILFVLLQMLSQVGEKFQGLKYITPLTLFAPKDIVAGKSETVFFCLALYLSGLCLYGIGVAVFSKRDLSL